MGVEIWNLLSIRTKLMVQQKRTLVDRIICLKISDRKKVNTYLLLIDAQSTSMVW